MLYKKAKEILEQNIANQCDEELSDALYTILDSSISKTNYVSKKKIRDFINGELDKIDNDTTINTDVLNGMKSAYLAMKNLFCGGK